MSVRSEHTSDGLECLNFPSKHAASRLDGWLIASVVHMPTPGVIEYRPQRHLRSRMLK
jgi:hypothetical protein